MWLWRGMSENVQTTQDFPFCSFSFFIDIFVVFKFLSTLWNRDRHQWFFFYFYYLVYSKTMWEFLNLCLLVQIIHPSMKSLRSRRVIQFEQHQCLMWPSSLLAEKKKEEEKKRTPIKGATEAHDAMRADLQTCYSQAFDDKRECAKWQNGKSVHGTDTPINLLRCVLFCAGSWLTARCERFTLGDNEAGQGPNNVCIEKNQTHFIYSFFFFPGTIHLQSSSSDAQLLVCVLNPKMFTCLIRAE